MGLARHTTGTLLIASSLRAHLQPRVACNANRGNAAAGACLHSSTNKDRDSPCGAVSMPCSVAVPTVKHLFMPAHHCSSDSAVSRLPPKGSAGDQGAVV